MNSKFAGIVKNLFYTLSANLLSTMITFILGFIVPKSLGAEQYGYWQLYTFYASYVGFFHFGWADGVYLRYGGKEYGDLDQELLHTQFWLLTALEIAISAGVSIFALWLSADAAKGNVLMWASFSCFLLLPRTYLQYVLQSTNRIREYARSVSLEKIVYCILVAGMLLAGVRRYEYLLLADVAAKAVSLVNICWICRGLVFSGALAVGRGIKEAWINISVGVKLMISNVAGLLIVGVVRFSIERVWDVATFGRVSLTLAASNMLMLFISAVSVVMFPILKRTPQEKWAENYRILNTVLVIPMLAMLVAYYPARIILSAWLPEYSESLTYMALLFPMCLYEGKMSMLINTYLKALRREKLMLVINAVSVGVSVGVSLIVIYGMKNLILAVLSILCLLVFRCELAEIFLTRLLGIRLAGERAALLAMTAAFVLTGWFIGGWLGFAVYSGAYLMYLWGRRKALLETFRFLRPFLKK